MKNNHLPSNRQAFTLVEMLITLAIIGLLAALTMGGYTYAMRGSKEKVTRGSFEALKSALERYYADFGEYPEPATPTQQVEILPNKLYNVGGAACLYQALTGDGFDQIKGVTAAGSGDATAKSDGKVQGDEVLNKKLTDIPQTIFTKKNGVYILIDGFGRPFQYTKAAIPTTSGTGTGTGTGSTNNSTATTINTTYDFWSYGMDDTNIQSKSIDSLKNPKIAAKWVKNW